LFNLLIILFKYGLEYKNIYYHLFFSIYNYKNIKTLVLLDFKNYFFYRKKSSSTTVKVTFTFSCIYSSCWKK